MDLVSEAFKEGIEGFKEGTSQGTCRAKQQQRMRGGKERKGAKKDGLSQSPS